ncbi:hypothetical protein [Rhizobium leguminosarum]
MVEVQLNQGVQAFGMSVTLGVASLNAANYWVNRYAQFVGGAVENRAISGTGLPSMVAQANAYAPYSGRTRTGLVDGPLNDVRQAASACLPSIKPAYDALISTLFSGSFRGASWPAPVVRAGVWSNLGTSYGGRSCFFPPNAPMQTTDPTASITFQFTGPIVCLHGFASETDDWLDLDIEIDGVLWGSTDWTFKARPGAGKQAVASVIDGLSAGAHTIKVKAPAAGIPSGHKCVIDGIQCPLIAAPVLLGSVPDIPDWTALGSIGTWADAQDCNAIIEQVANEWAARGYPVGYVTVENIRAWNADGVHPVDRGHLNWALCYLAGTRIKP